MLYPETKQISGTKNQWEKKNKKHVQNEKQNKATTDKHQGKADHFH